METSTDKCSKKRKYSKEGGKGYAYRSIQSDSAGLLKQQG
jgi:hypothetical protein